MKHKKAMLITIIIFVIFLIATSGYVIQQYFFKCTKDSCSIKMEEEYKRINQEDTNLKKENKK